ncbi:MAG: hypothetical protein NVV59_09130 [Chitinophagaceae bacterium]|nr:hypothetical protein [Chitinophagaceae bacterium]
MTRTFNKTLLYVMSLMALVAVLVSCEKDDQEKNSGVVELINFGPTGARHGDTIRFLVPISTK